MNPARNRQIQELYEAALARPAAERGSFVSAHAAGDDGLRESVELLLSRSEATHVGRASTPAPEGPHASLAAGTQIGSYRIESLVAEGGIGRVYRATDTKLHRPVAIKFLSSALADEQARRRFTQEAEATSSLNHPHIVTVHDVGEHDGHQYIVSELVDGGTLGEWAARPHPWKQRVELLIGVADALAAAHAAGILHRDIKPGNILIGSNGYAKLADFGLAKLFGERATDPTRTRTQETAIGVVIGTVAYMSPEQVAGQPLDERSDVFSFGVVLYEVLTGRRPFEGSNDLELMKTIVHGTPRPLPATLPELLRMVVDKALEKDPAERYQSMRELVVDLKRVVQKRAAAPAAAAEPAPRAARVLWLVAGALGVALVAALVPATAYFFRHEPAAAAVRFAIDAPGLLRNGSSLAVSPDGARVAFVATTEGKSRIWIHALDAVDALPVTGTDGALDVFWSPDGRALAFHADAKLKKIVPGADAAQVLTDAPLAAGLDWSRDGTILFGSAEATKGTGIVAIGRIASDGGAVTPVTTVDVANRQIAHFDPKFLPDGRRFIYGAGSTEGDNQRRVTVYLGALDGSQPKSVLVLATGVAGSLTEQATYAAGHLLFARRGTLFAQRIDATNGVLSGDPQPLVSSVGKFAASDKTLAYLESVSVGSAQTVGAITELRWFDRDGRSAGSVGAAAAYDNPMLSPDGRRLAVDIVDDGNRDVWIIDLAHGVPARRTFAAAADAVPVWSPDGQQVVFGSGRDGGANLATSLYRHAADGSGADELVYSAGAGSAIAPLAWTRDGSLLFTQTTVAELQTRSDIFVLPLSGERTPPVKLLQSPGRKGAARVSPDGRWVAYSTNESGSYQVVVQPFPDAAQGKWQISTRGGVEAKWRGDGRELFYLATDGTLMAVDVEAGKTFVAGAPHALFNTGLAIPAVPFSLRFDVSDDGQRFLINVPREAAAESRAAGPNSIKVVMNWTSLLERGR